MELTLYLVLAGVTLFFTYLSFSKTADQTIINQFIAGLLWFALSFNSLVIHYFIPNGSTSSYTAITKNSEYYQILLAVLYGAIGFLMWYL